MGDIEKLIATKPNPQWQNISAEAARDSIGFAASLKDGNHWRTDAAEKISEKIDVLGSELLGLELKTAFALRGTARVAGDYVAGNSPDMSLARAFMKKLIDHSVRAQAEAVRQFSRPDTAPERQDDLREFQELLFDTIMIFSKITGVAA